MEAFKLGPFCTKFFINLATCYSKMGKVEKTLDFSNGAICVEWTDVKALYIRTAINVKIDQFDKAHQKYSAWKRGPGVVVGIGE